MQFRIQSFPPIISKKSKILILGSIPGTKSLEKKEYYAHPQNHFWKILFCMFGEEFSADYQDRLELLEKYHIALWDTIESCEREGSQDVKIKNETANQIPDLLEKHSNIKAVFCNGQKSYKNLIKLLGSDFHLPIILLPSTSPLHTISFDKKLEDWKKILEYISSKTN